LPLLRTKRLLLRQWEPSDLAAARDWHSDPDVMRHLGGPLSAPASDATIQRWTAEWDGRCRGMFAVCTQDDHRPIGTVGLGCPTFDSHFTPCTEIGWRLDRRAWGHGFASEAASAVLRDGFERLALTEIVAFAAVDNIASHRVMARIGMRRDVDGDFFRRSVPHQPAALHVLWRLRSNEFERTR
jgi:RimJ/RimL family protein N-acetyltransferase